MNTYAMTVYRWLRSTPAIERDKARRWVEELAGDAPRLAAFATVLRPDRGDEL